MKIFRGENIKLEQFDIYAGSSETMSEYGPGKYFFNFKHRNRALVYALDNHTSLFDEDADADHLEVGYFYECSINQDESRTLEKISISEIGDVEDVVNNLLDNTLYDVNFLEKFRGKSEEEKYESFIDSISNNTNIYGLILDLYRIIRPSNNNEFCSALEPLFDAVNSNVAIPPDGLGEVIVYAPSRIKIIKVIPVTDADLERTREERMTLSSRINN